MYLVEQKPQAKKSGQREVEAASREAYNFRWSLSTSSRAGFRLIDRWLEQCLEDHESCSLEIGTHRPTRLLDLETGLCSGDMKLVLTRDLDRQPFATLSYRWGARKNVMLTREIHDGFRNQISVSMLPGTIRDAIQVCRGLSIRYLWVDALCIMQGDPDDFATEITRMGSIYDSSIFTIAATESIDSDSGLLRSRQSLQT